MTTKKPMHKKKFFLQWFYTFINNLKKRIKNGAKTTKLERNLLPKETIKVSEKQLLMIVTEKLKAEQENTTFSWNKISKALNAEGPIIKSATMWCTVSVWILKVIIKTN